MMNSIITIKVLVAINGKQVTLTLQEAKDLHAQLNEMLSDNSEPHKTVQPVYTNPLVNPLTGTPVVTCEVDKINSISAALIG